jgi:hypothetical protein
MPQITQSLPAAGNLEQKQEHEYERGMCAIKTRAMSLDRSWLAHSRMRFTELNASHSDTGISAEDPKVIEIAIDWAPMDTSPQWKRKSED